jgi:predicted RNA-binding Zn ribbon-like protein
MYRQLNGYMVDLFWSSSFLSVTDWGDRRKSCMSEPEHQEFRDGVPFLGGSLWIDLLNTTPLLAGEVQDLLASPAGLRRWAGLAGIALPEAAEGEASVVALREVLRLGFDAMAQGLPVPEDVATAVNRLLAQVRVSLRLEASVDGLALVQSEVAIEAPVATAVALDFARFVTGYEAARLRHCANPACNMVFHDHGKNNRRRWCSMEICGNRDKVARYRARQRGEG